MAVQVFEGLERRVLMAAAPSDVPPVPSIPVGSSLGGIDHIIVVYQENWSFDGLYGNFPGANGIANASQASLTQRDRLDGLPYTQQAGQPFDLASGSLALATPPQPINGSAVDARFPAGLDTLHPYDAGQFLQPGDKTGDIVHRYWQEQSQIDGGKQDQYVSWSDNPGLVMSHFDATNLPEGLLAQQYTMDDNFFHAAYGGSFLNHQWLVAAASPVFQNAPASLQPTLDPSGELALDLTGTPATNPNYGKIIHDGNVTPITGRFDQHYAVNTIFSKNLVPNFKKTTDTDLLPSQNDSNPSDPTRPYIPTIGDRLDDTQVSWKWYSGGWDAAVASSPSNPTPATPATVDPLFQWHHQPLAYYDNYAPFLPNGQRNPRSAAHLQDETNFFADVQNGTLPAVSFVKPLGPDNEHPGYASLLQGQQHVADIVKAVQANPSLWSHTAIVVTYDEHGGRWDHVAPPDANGIWGDGTRVPGIVISPLAKKGVVDHTEHDTLSILKTIEERFGVSPLDQYDAQASDLSSSLLSQTQTTVSKVSSIVNGTPTLKATVTAADGSTVNGGTVTFTVTGANGQTILTQSTPVVDGAAKVGAPLGGAKAGKYTVTATYDPGSTGPISVAGSQGSNSLSVGYAIQVLSDSTKPRQSGSTIPFAMRLLDANGKNVSAADLKVLATGFTLASKPSTVYPAKMANGSNRFTFQGSGSSARYTFDLKTPKGLAKGVYLLDFFAGSDPSQHTLGFVIG